MTMSFKTAILGLLAIVGFLLMPKSAGTEVTSGPYQPLAPYRVLDTRDTFIVEPESVVPVNTRLPGGATGAAVNITITQPQAFGHVTAWDGRSPMPLASIINVTAPGETVANFAIVPVNQDGTFHLYASTRMHLVVDVMGFVAGPNYGNVNSFTWANGTQLVIGSSGWVVTDGRESLAEAIRQVDSCFGAVLWTGELDSMGIIAAHRTACGSRGFSGVETMDYGERIMLRLPDGRERWYELFWKKDGMPTGAKDIGFIPYDTTIVLQTSQDAGHVYLRYFRLV